MKINHNINSWRWNDFSNEELREVAVSLRGRVASDGNGSNGIMLKEIEQCIGRRRNIEINGAIVDWVRANVDEAAEVSGHDWEDEVTTTMICVIDSRYYWIKYAWRDNKAVEIEREDGPMR